MTATAAPAPVLRTERLTLRAYEMADFDAYAAFYASERSLHVGGPLKRERVWPIFAADVGAWWLKGFGWWTIEVDGRPAGHVGLQQPPHFADIEIGWTLYDGFEGRGIAREAAETARAWGRAHVALDRLVSYIAEGNRRSIALAERMGAVRDGTVPDTEGSGLVYLHPVP